MGRDLGHSSAFNIIIRGSERNKQQQEHTLARTTHTHVIWGENNSAGEALMW